MKDFIAGAIAFSVVGLIALGGLALILIVQPLFWFAVMTAILVSKL